MKWKKSLQVVTSLQVRSERNPVARQNIVQNTAVQLPNLEVAVAATITGGRRVIDDDHIPVVVSIVVDQATVGQSRAPSLGRGHDQGRAVTTRQLVDAGAQVARRPLQPTTTVVGDLSAKWRRRVDVLECLV